MKSTLPSDPTGPDQTSKLCFDYKEAKNMTIIQRINTVSIVCLFALLFIYGAEAAQQTSRITGYVVYGEVRDKPLNDLEVKITAEGGRLIKKVTTNRNGYYTTEKLPPGKYIVSIDHPKYNPAEEVVRIRGGQDARQNFSLLDRAAVGDTNFRVTLTWCDKNSRAVRDVDTYLSIPDVAEPLYYGRKGANYQGTHLDVDDVDWRGPETTTIHELRDGTYVFYVNNYSDRSKTRALGNSEVNVQVYQGANQVRTFQVPQGRGITYEVFRIENGRIVPVEKYNDRLEVSGSAG